jgi:hypothetical protein
MLTFDVSIYFPIPQLNTEGYISLIRSMLMVAPKNPPPHVAAAIDVLKKVLTEGEAQLVLRIDEDLSTSIERAFDILVDYVWSETRTRLEFAAIYSHEGAAKFTAEDREQLDIEERIEEGRVAVTMLERMFGNGTDFLRTPYAEQATHMGARLDWIDSKSLEPALEELVGAKLVALLKVCQQRYEAMVGERASRDGKSVADLRELRNLLRRQIAAYCGAVGTMHAIDDAESAKVVEDALRPILVARARARRKALGLSDEDELIVDDELSDEDEDEDEVEADQAEIESDKEADEIDDEVEGD